MPTTGRSTGRVHTALVQAMASKVWLATWPTDSPVTRAWMPFFSATAQAMRIMKRRMRMVNSSSGQERRSSS